MHILIIPSWYKTKDKPILGTFFEEQARMFLKRGCKVGILYPYHNLRFIGNLRFKKFNSEKDFFDKGINTYYSITQSYIPKYSLPTQIDLFQARRKGYIKYKKYEKENGKPDLIHAHSVLWGGIVGNYISKKEKIPFFLTKHFTGWLNNKDFKTNKTYKNLLSKTINNSKKTFVVSSFYKKELLKIYKLNKTKLKVIPNIVNDIFFENKSKVKIVKKIKLIVIGYLIDRKNHLNLFNAIKLLKKRGHNIKLTVVGDGLLRSDLERYVLNNKLNQNIEFTGLLNRNATFEKIKNSHILISTSILETFGVSIAEGLAVGRPCVVFNSGGPEDIVREKDGILFSENSAKSIAKEINNLIDNYNKYDQEEISDSCYKRFGEEKIFKSLTNEFKK